MGLRLGPERQVEGVVALLTNPGVPTSLRLMGARLPYQASPDARIRFEMRCPGAHAVHLAATLQLPARPWPVPIRATLLLECSSCKHVSLEPGDLAVLRYCKVEKLA